MRIIAMFSENLGKGMKVSKPFIREQLLSLEQFGVEYDILTITEKGYKGYYKALKKLKKMIREKEYSLIHSFYGLVGFLSNMQRRVPVVTTYLGSDIYMKKNYKFASLSARLSGHNIYVEEKLSKHLKNPGDFSIIPFGIDLKNFFPKSREECRKYFNFSGDKNYIMFSSSFARPEKNYKLAKEAVDIIGNTEIIELGKSYTIEELNMLMSACDMVLMTSLTEGSPQIVKEALAANCPVVSTDVGDVASVIQGVEGCHLTTFEPEDIARKIKQVLDSKKRINGLDSVQKFEINRIAERIFNVYQNVISK